MSEEITGEDIARARDISASFAVFPKAEALLRRAIAAQEVLKTLDAEKASRESAIEQAKQSVAEAEKNAANRKSQLSAEVARLEESASKRKAELNTAMADMDAKMTQAKADFDKFNAKVESDRADLEKLTKAKIAEHEAVKKAFDAFKSEHKLG